MQSNDSQYHRADSVSHAIELLEAHPDAEILAGGHVVLPDASVERAGPDVVVDVGAVEAIQRMETDGDVLRIGALATYASIVDWDALQSGAPVLADAVGEIGDTQVQNRATIGGNLVAPAPISDLPAALVVSDATLVVEGPQGERRIDADEFVRSGSGVDLDRAELLTHIEVPQTAGAVGDAYVKRPSPFSRTTLVGVATRLQIDDGIVSAARVAANGVVDYGVRLSPVEEVLDGEPLTSGLLQTAAARSAAGLDESTIRDDSDASASYRAHMLEVLVEQALERSAERTGASVASGPGIASDQ